MQRFSIQTIQIKADTNQETEWNKVFTKKHRASWMNGTVELMLTKKNPPACAYNPARAYLCSLFYDGGKQRFKFKLNFPVTQNHNITPLNFGNRLTFVFTRHKPAYYPFSGPNNAEAPNVKDPATKASRLFTSSQQFQN